MSIRWTSDVPSPISFTLITGADKAILAAVVVNQPFTMVATVVFDRQVLTAVKQVWTT